MDKLQETPRKIFFPVSKLGKTLDIMLAKSTY